MKAFRSFHNCARIFGAVQLILIHTFGHSQTTEIRYNKGTGPPKVFVNVCKKIGYRKGLKVGRVN